MLGVCGFGSVPLGMSWDPSPLLGHREGSTTHRATNTEGRTVGKGPGSCIYMCKEMNCDDMTREMFSCALSHGWEVVRRVAQGSHHTIRKTARNVRRTAQTRATARKTHAPQERRGTLNRRQPRDQKQTDTFSFLRGSQNIPLGLPVHTNACLKTI